MKLDSCRGLKAQLLDQLEDPLTLAPRAISAFGLSTGRHGDLDRVQPTLALGVRPLTSRPDDYQLAIRIQHRGLEQAAHVDAIEREAQGEVHVRYVGRIVKYSNLWHRARQRPLLIGSSVGHVDVTAGTLGCFVMPNAGGRGGSALILSNNHVLADEGRGSRGDAVVQPGRFDDGRPADDAIGRLEQFVAFEKNGTNLLDCAIATVDDGIECDLSGLRGIGTLAGVAAPEETDAVEKLGRTTGHTNGRISAFELDNVVVGYDTGNFRFNDQIEIETTETVPFSRGGDSGSLIVDSSSRMAVALLFAGTDVGGQGDLGLTYANPIGPVLQALEVELLTS